MCIYAMWIVAYLQLVYTWKWRRTHLHGLMGCPGNMVPSKYYRQWKRRDRFNFYCMYAVWFGLLGVNASATARVISRRWNDDDEISFLVEETGVPGGNHRPTASNWWNFSHIRPLPSPGIELGPQRCEAKWVKAWWERRLSSPSYRACTQHKDVY